MSWQNSSRTRLLLWRWRWYSGRASRSLLGLPPLPPGPSGEVHELMEDGRRPLAIHVKPVRRAILCAIRDQYEAKPTYDVMRWTH